MKIQYKIIYILITVLVIYTLLFSGFIYYSISNYSFEDFYKRLEIRAATTAKIQLERPEDVSSIKEMRQEFLEKLPNQQEYIYIIDQQDKLIFKSGTQPLPDDFLNKVMQTSAASFNEKSILYSGIRYETLRGDEYIVVVSAENYFYTHHVAYLRNLLVTSLLYATMLIVVVSLILSRTLIRPIQNIIKEVKKISTENLHLRLETPEKDDSIGKLVLTFNDMLTRLETSFETQKNFISNASHELNTPLTTIIGEADFALSKPRSAEEYVKSLNHIFNEAEKLDKKTKALLLLAQTGFNGKTQKFDKVRVDQLILDVKETVEKINPAFKITFDFSLLPEDPTKLKVKGNEQLLHLALTNIIVNGCKYSDEAPVEVALGASDSKVIIVVRDSGIGIPKDEIQYIYDPYFRASNTGNYEGYGIGLPLTRNIVRLHEGELIVNSTENEGTTVQITLPIGNYKF
ncbi:signal transduction histidine kinase [Roseivirga pacifica]|uniref:histidine kinase n=1 Tax=Roseivirga pacifica TaxID=1267423 RepID=A0A1I0R8N6_9BACT|nr:HAMP domain-containing sensor histidine kinase [Roseivirga pacifica]MCO6358505.1 HAMP domain-containing protein [Roseivirga pacifica]MCO6369060.1 HAMP domain-containing protein [Roseivirga pacifica]MCO6372236.1 HAMP domain-containing protein [Roseivirga pacifica]MCO6374236.1 HAMP domain-containing protein [Roseivirga pacifica]MCO6380967.1 HAMP domain-containing protein [Roseivirga pacifica]